MPPINSMNDKSVLNMLPNFDDPVEQSLASLEQSLACKLTNQDSVDSSQSDKYAAKSSINQMIPGYDNPHHNNGNNGFSMDSTLNNLNGMTNIPSSVPNNMMMSLPSLTQSNTMPPVTSDSISTSTGTLTSLTSRNWCDKIVREMLIHSNVLGFMPGLTTSSGNLPPASLNSSINATAPINSNSNSNTNNNNMNSSIPSTGNGITAPNLSVGPFRPKPIEELLMPQHDKKGTPPALPQQIPMSDQKPNLSNAFNKSMDPSINKTIAR